MSLRLAEERDQPVNKLGLMLQANEVVCCIDSAVSRNPTLVEPAYYRDVLLSPCILVNIVGWEKTLPELPNKDKTVGR